jgi:PLP dependent protein
MCVPPADVEPAPYFALLAKMAREEGLPRLSMGMSGDFETALMLGATDIRVGTALFGERAPVSRPVPRSGLGMIRNAPAR